MELLGQLINEAEKLAKKTSDGHISMLKFTTGWKVFLGTPNLDTGEERESINEMKSFSTLEQALNDFVKNPTSIWSQQ